MLVEPLRHLPNAPPGKGALRADGPGLPGTIETAGSGRLLYPGIISEKQFLDHGRPFSAGIGECSRCDRVRLFLRDLAVSRLKTGLVLLPADPTNAAIGLARGHAARPLEPAMDRHGGPLRVISARREGPD